MRSHSNNYFRIITLYNMNYKFIHLRLGYKLENVQYLKHHIQPKNIMDLSTVELIEYCVELIKTTHKYKKGDSQIEIKVIMMSNKYDKNMKEFCPSMIGVWCSNINENLDDE